MHLTQRPFRKVYRHQVEKELPDNPTSKDVLDIVFGNYNEFSKYDVIHRQYCKKTPLQRLNMIWVILFTLAVAPYQYVKYGAVGWDTNTKLGRFFLKITGELKE